MRGIGIGNESRVGTVKEGLRKGTTDTDQIPEMRLDGHQSGSVVYKHPQKLSTDKVICHSDTCLHRCRNRVPICIIHESFLPPLNQVGRSFLLFWSTLRPGSTQSRGQTTGVPLGG